MGRLITILLSIIILVFPATSFADDCGDVNNDEATNIFDITYLITYLYLGGPEPDCGISFAGICGDVNNDSTINIFDITYLINHLYMGGPEPNCGETGIVIDIDGNIYQTLKIGDQWWMAENLKVTHYRNGEPIPHVTDNSAWTGLSTGAYCNYDNNEDHVVTYGRLYNWYTVVDSRNIAPEGWHVPTDTEWKQLEMYLGMSQAEADATGYRGTDEGGKLKEVGTTHWNSPNAGATNESSFTALPGGFRNYEYGSYFGIGNDGIFWSSTEYTDEWKWYRRLYYNYSVVTRDNCSKRYGFSVRCVRD